MNEVGLCENGITVKVIRESTGLQLLVTASDHPGAVACFPTHESLLAGVTKGYSYQVASPEGSLTVSSDEDTVSLSFDGGAIGRKKCRVNKHEFERAIHDLHNSDV